MQTGFWIYMLIYSPQQNETKADIAVSGSSIRLQAGHSHFSPGRLLACLLACQQVACLFANQQVTRFPLLALQPLLHG